MGVELCIYRARVGCHHPRAATPKRNNRLSIIDIICISIIVRYYPVGLPFVLYLLVNCDILIVQCTNHYICNNIDISDTARCGKFLSCQAVNNSYFAILLLMAGDVAENPGPENPISICHLNAQSMYNKLDSIALELSTFDIITLSETWLDQSIDSSSIIIPNYQEPIRLDRNRQGGGVAMYFKNTIPFIIHRELEIPNLEVIWAEVSLKGKRLLIGTFYIHPRFSDWDLIDLSIEQAIQLCPNIILIGDFNQNMKEPRKSKNIRNIINTYNLQQLVETPTRSTATTSTLIDLILISDSLHAVEKCVIEPFCSDHSAVYFSTNFISVSERSYKRKIWQYNNADYELYRETLDNMQWNFTNLSVEDQVQLVTKNMTRAAENSIPHKIVTIG